MTTKAPLLSPLWYRVAYLKPRLRPGVRVARQTVRGRTWHVLTDPLSGRHHRFDARAYGLIATCDGSATVDALWSRRVDADGDEAPTQGQAIEILAQAFRANLLSGDVVADARAAMRAQRRDRARRLRAALNPLSFKLPLWNPERWLGAHVQRVGWLFSPAATAAVLLAMLLGALLLAAHTSELARETARQLEQGRVLLLFWLVYPWIKLLHELAHAFAVKAYGGEVHEIGVAVLLLTPVPYVDASAASAFEDKRQRAVVAGAGIAVEWLLAAVALAAWLAMQPGLARDLALVVAVIGGVSTLVVNGNPLLRFDGYHLLCDLLELPNLAPRSARWWQAHLQRWVAGRDAAEPEAAHGSERFWLAFYAPASWLVRGGLSLLLALALARWNAWVGLGIALLAAWSLVASPLVGVLRWLVTADVARLARGRTFGTTGLAAAGLAAFAFLAPLPHHTLAPGVVWLPDEALVRPGSGGFVDAVLVADGQVVTAGTPLVQLRDEALALELQSVRAELEQQRVERHAWLGTDDSRAAQAADRMQALEAEQQRLEARIDALVLRARSNGHVAIDTRRVVIGRWLPQGQLAAQVLAPGAPVVRALVANEDIADVRALVAQHAREVDSQKVGVQKDGVRKVPTAAVIAVALAHSGRAVPAQWLRGVPRASRQLVTPALGTRAGGTLAVDGSDPQGLTALEPRFEVELELPRDVRVHVGERAWVSFRHDDATLANLSVQFLRRAFLRHFAVGVSA